MIDIDDVKRTLPTLSTQIKFCQYVLELIPRTVQGLSAWAVLPFRAETRELLLLYEYTRNYAFFPGTKCLGYKEGFEGLAALRKQAVWNDNFRQALETRVIKSLVQPHSESVSVYVQPIVTGERLAGVLALYFNAPFPAEQKWVNDLEVLANTLAVRMEELLLAAPRDEHARTCQNISANIDKIVSIFPDIARVANWDTALNIVLRMLRTVVDYSACGVFHYLPKESRILLEAHVQIDQKRFSAFSTDITQNPVVDIIINHTSYLEEKDPGKLKILGDYRSAIGIPISCSKEHDIALILLHEQSFKYHRSDFEYLKKFAQLFEIICLKRDAEEALEITQAKIMAGELTPMLIHEIRNLLNFSQNEASLIRNFLTSNRETLRTVIPEPQLLDTQIVLIESMLDGQKNSKDILEKYLEVTGRPRRQEPIEVIDLNTTIDRVIHLLQSEATHKGLYVIREFQQGLPPLQTDAYKLQRVIINLILNAIQALPRGKTITVSTRHNQEDTLPFTIQIRDNGPGISSLIIDRIYDPYFTTKKEGTGLGLAVCKQFMQSLGGEIKVESVITRGTGFTLHFPAKQEDRHE